MSIYHFRNNPTFGQQVAGGLASGYEKQQASAQRLKEAELTNRLKSQSKLAEMAQKQEFAQSLFGGESGEGGFDFANLSDKDIAMAALVDPTLGNILRSTKDAQTKQSETAAKLQREEDEAAAAHEAYKKAGLPVPEEHIPGTSKSTYDILAKHKADPNIVKREDLARKKTGYLETIDDLEKMIKYTGSTQIPFTKSYLGHSLNRQAVQKREEFDVLAFSLEGFLREMNTKGVLPQKVFNVLLTKLPSSKLSERANRGRLDAIKKQVSRYLPGDAEESNESGSQRVNVYDSNGKLAGTVEMGEVGELPPGYRVE